MKFTVFSPQLRKAGALGIATLMLSTVAQAADSATSLVTTTASSVPDIVGKRLPVVPEANAALVLIPVVAAVLFFSIRRFRIAKAALDSDRQ